MLEQRPNDTAPMLKLGRRTSFAEACRRQRRPMTPPSSLPTLEFEPIGTTSPCM
jgi:hypothetical protein